MDATFIWATNIIPVCGSVFQIWNFLPLLAYRSDLPCRLYSLVILTAKFAALDVSGRNLIGFTSVLEIWFLTLLRPTEFRDMNTGGLGHENPNDIKHLKLRCLLCTEPYLQRLPGFQLQSMERNGYMYKVIHLSCITRPD